MPVPGRFDWKNVPLTAYLTNHQTRQQCAVWPSTTCRLDFLMFEEACEISALEFERLGRFGLITLGPFHGACDDVPAVLLHGLMVGQVKIGL